MKNHIAALLCAGLFLQTPLSAYAADVTYTPLNIVNLRVTDKSGREITSYYGQLCNENDVLAYLALDGSFFENETDSDILGARGGQKCFTPIPWSVFEPHASGDTIEQLTIPGIGHSTLYTYGKNNPYIHFGESETFEIQSYSSTAAPAFTLPANTAAFYADAAWQNKPIGFTMETLCGSINVNYPADSANEHGYTQFGTVATYPKSAASSDDMLYATYPDKTSSFMSHGVSPILAEEAVGYDLRRVHMQDLFREATTDGKVVVEGRTYDLRNDTRERAALLLLRSGSAVTAAIPDANGFVNCYVSRKTNDISAELTYNFRDTSLMGCDVLSGSCYGGNRDAITVTVPALPETGYNLAHMPAGNYTLYLSDIMDESAEPKPYPFTVRNSEDVQYVDIIIGEGILYGDVDENGQVNAADAALVLKAASFMGSGGNSGLSKTQEDAADVNMDGAFNAADAALILQYAAYTGTGGSLMLEEYLKKYT